MTFKIFTINSQEFAREPQILKGTLAADELPRLAELGGQLHYQFDSSQSIRALSSGNHPVENHPSVQLFIQAQLTMPCQRCLESMPLVLDLHFDYIVSAQMPEILADVDEVDWIEASPAFDLASLIEDEVLAAIPIAPMHESACGQQKMHSGEKLNAFEMLKNLKLNK